MENKINFKTGVDIESISRIKKCITNESFLKKVFTSQEIEYCEQKSNPAQHFTARFCAKEAVIKALSYLKNCPMYNEIEVLNRKDGSPFVNILNKNVPVDDISISLSHSGDTAIASVFVFFSDRNRYLHAKNESSAF